MTEIQFLKPVEPAALRNTWAEIRDRVAGISARYSEPWIADDVFHELLNLNSHLWATEDLSCFIVIRLFATDFERVLFIWVGCNNGGPDISDYLPQVHDIAAANNCARIQWESPRKFHRALPGVRVRYSYSIEAGGLE